MGLMRVFVFYCVMCSIKEVTMANEIMEGDGEIAPPEAKNREESPEKAPPDSHEAMNDRQTSVDGARAKRSYEFLVGLINNNSRYEVTRVDPALTTQKPKIVSDDVSASEVLLELMVRIAAHPGQWRRVHTLLKSIDDDLMTSKNVIKKLQEDNLHQITQKINNTNPKFTKSEVNVEEKYNTARLPKLNTSVIMENTEKTEKPDTPIIVESTWPTFEERSEEVVSRLGTKGSDTRSSTRKPSKSTYPKNFVYHRVTEELLESLPEPESGTNNFLEDNVTVEKLPSTSSGIFMSLNFGGTGRPIDVNKSPRAYIAVSVIALKPTNTRSKEDEIALENELHQLKPWTHQDNLQKMASIRSRWVIGEGEKRAKGW